MIALQRSDCIVCPRVESLPPLNTRSDAKALGGVAISPELLRTDEEDEIFDAAVSSLLSVTRPAVLTTTRDFGSDADVRRLARIPRLIEQM